MTDKAVSQTKSKVFRLILNVLHSPLNSTQNNQLQQDVELKIRVLDGDSVTKKDDGSVQVTVAENSVQKVAQFQVSSSSHDASEFLRPVILGTNLC